MKFSFAKKPDAPGAEIAALKSQLENARRRITELTLETIQQANAISVLQDYRGATPETIRQMLRLGRNISLPAVAANAEAGILLTAAAS
jgi:hypothetical protein